MAELCEHRPIEFVGVTTGTLIYIGVAKRDDFDRIAVSVSDRGETENGHVLTKSVEGNGVRVIFQHWLKYR